MPDPTQLQQEDDSLDLLISANSDPPAVGKKVELDLDDAPFLQAEEKAPDLPSTVDAVPDAPDDSAKKNKKRKLLIIGAIALGVLAMAAAAAWWFFFRTPPPALPAGPEPEVIVVPKAAPPGGPYDIVREFAPFTVPVKNAAGQTNFLVCKFSAITTDPGISREIDQQRIPLRDAIYFYLRNKNSDFLLDARNAPQIKTELISVFNDYLSQGKLEDILFESYLNH